MLQMRDDDWTMRGKGRWVLTKLPQSAKDEKKKSIVYSFKGEPEEKEVMTFENEMIKQYTFLKIKGDTKEWRKGVVGP